MDLKLKDKVVIVTGGSKGIGLGITKALIGEGAIPVMVSRNKESLESVAKEIENSGADFFYVIADLVDPIQCKNAVEQVVKKFGRIDGLVNNAGVNDGVSLENGNYEDFVSSLHKSLIHYYLMAHHALPELKKNKGSILNYDFS